MDNLELERILAISEPERRFRELLIAVVNILRVDRCFLLVRHPPTRMYRNFCYRIDPDLPDTGTGGWQKEEEWEREDPMFRAALAAKPSIFVDDIETAPADVLNKRFERDNLGHRALIHAHIRQDGVLWGILQPCVFDRPRVWNEFDRDFIEKLLPRLTPAVIEYVGDNFENR